jgi:hypothetical protein
MLKENVLCLQQFAKYSTLNSLHKWEDLGIQSRPHSQFGFCWYLVIDLLMEHKLENVISWSIKEGDRTRKTNQIRPLYYKIATDLPHLWTFCSWNPCPQIWCSQRSSWGHWVFLSVSLPADSLGCHLLHPSSRYVGGCFSARFSWSPSSTARLLRFSYVSDNSENHVFPYHWFGSLGLYGMWASTVVRFQSIFIGFKSVQSVRDHNAH